MKYKLLFAALASTVLSTLVVGNQDGAAQPKPHLVGMTDKDPLTYRPNEAMAFTLTPHGNGTTIRWKRTGDDGKVQQGEAKADAPVIVKTSLYRPGFVRLCERATDALHGRSIILKLINTGSHRAQADDRVRAFDGCSELIGIHELSAVCRIIIVVYDDRRFSVRFAPGLSRDPVFDTHVGVDIAVLHQLIDGITDGCIVEGCATEDDRREPVARKRQYAIVLEQGHCLPSRCLLHRVVLR